MLEEGPHSSIRDLAAAEGVDRAYVGRVLNLTLLPPDLVEAILDGRESKGGDATGTYEANCGGVGVSGPNRISASSWGRS
jgi:hypothetical protein